MHSDVRDLGEYSICVEILSGQSVALRAFSRPAHGLAALLLACPQENDGGQLVVDSFSLSLHRLSFTATGLPRGHYRLMTSKHGSPALDNGSASPAVLKYPHDVGNVSLYAPKTAASAESIVLKGFSPLCSGAMSAAGRQVLSHSHEQIFDAGYCTSCPTATSGVGMHQCIVKAINVQVYEQCMILLLSVFCVSTRKSLCAK